MSHCFTDPTIDELLDDSLTQGLMQADKVDVPKLKMMLRKMATAIENRPVVRHDRYQRSGSNWTQVAAVTSDMLPPIPTSSVPACVSYEAMGACTAC